MKNWIVAAIGCLASASAFADYAVPLEIGARRQAAVELNTKGQTEYRIETPDAAYIKVDFGKLQLAPGAELSVSNADGSEIYRYSSDKRDGYTYDVEAGQDGLSSFAAMSISGPVAIVRLQPGLTSSRTGSSVQVTGYYEGYPEAVLAQLDQQELLGSTESGRSICGVDDKRDVACYGTTTLPYSKHRPIARLLIGGRSLCTGWRVGSGDRMLTNNHCFTTSAQAAGTEVWFNYQRTTCGGTTNATTTKVTGKSVLRTDYTLDYTLYTINNPSTVSSFGYLSLDVRAPVTNEEIFIVQHPGGKPKQIGSISDRDTGNTCRINIASTSGNGTATDAGYYCDTEGGSSGSPVLARSSGKVIALHHLGGCVNKGVRIDRIWPQIQGYFPSVP